jgi:hypothetical protein
MEYNCDENQDQNAQVNFKEKNNIQGDLLAECRNPQITKIIDEREQQQASDTPQPDICFAEKQNDILYFGAVDFSDSHFFPASLGVHGNGGINAEQRENQTHGKKQIRKP